MTRPIGRNWWVFGLCSVVLASATVWLTFVTLRLDTEKAAARAETAHQAKTTEVLWQMDTWLAPQLAHEAARPYFEYEAYYPQQKAYTRILSEIEQGEVLIPSPLLTYRSDLFLLHFQLAEGDELSSPQVPKSNWRDLTQGTAGDDLDLETPAIRLAELQARIPAIRAKLQACYTIAAAANNQTAPAPSPRANEYSARSRSTDQARGSATQNLAWAARKTKARGQVLVGPLLPVWIPNPGSKPGAGGSSDTLLFVRHVQLSDQNLFQGFLADWTRLRAALLEQVDDLSMAEVNLSPIRAGTIDHDFQMMATVPARLHSPMPTSVNEVETTTLIVLFVVWGGLLASLLAVGFAVHSTNQLGQRRARFASTVTHELRTPLTTFRMYSEMLAEDMIQDPAKRLEYLETLTGEADRLSRLVENVLSYARIEDGRFRCNPERIRLQALIERVRPVLEQRTRESGHTLELAAHDSVELDVDVDALTQILFNLVDNACKYAVGVEDKRIEIDARVLGGTLRIEIRDHGPGIEPRLRRAVFRPFERAQNANAPEQPGVGLGLALARALAEDLGGRLELAPGDVPDGAAPNSGPGATFTLEIPL